MFETEIKAALQKAGLAESLFDRITVKSVDEIEGAVAKLKADIEKVKTDFTENELFEVLEKAGLKEAAQKIFDRKVTEAMKAHEDKQKKAAKEAAEKERKEKESGTMTEEQKRIQALEDANKALLERVDSLVTKINTGDLDSRIRAELKKSGLAEEFASYVKVDDPEKISEAVMAFKSKIDAQSQAIIDKKVEAGDLSTLKKGTPGTTPQESQIIEYAKSIGVGNKPVNPDFQGKLSGNAAPANTNAKAAT